MSLPWVADERRCQQALHATLEKVSAGDRRKAGVFPEPLADSGSWSFATLVGWWLRAGCALHRVSEAGRTELQNRVGRGPGEGLYAPLWIATRFTTLRLPPDGLPAHVAASEPWAAQNAAYPAYLQKLLLWVTSVTGKDRPRPSINDPVKDPQGWVEALEQEFTTIRDDAAALLGDRFELETGPDLMAGNLADWLAIWLDWRSKDAAIWRVRRPVVHVSGGRRTTFIKGVAVLQPPGSLARDAVQQLAAARQTTAARVLGEVAARWRGGLLPSTAVREALKTQSCPADLVDRLVLPAVRAIVAAVAAERSATDGGDSEATVERKALANVRLALALDGFEVRPGPAPTAGSDRMIPHSGESRKGAEGLSFTCKAADIDVPVGWLGEPTACDEALLAPLEAVDWRLWALQHLAGDDTSAKVAALVVKAAKPSGWEPLKRRVLLGPTDADAVVALIDFVHTRRLALELLRSLLEPEAVAGMPLDAFIQEYGGLERVAFERLLALDPGAPKRLDPPRRADGMVDVAAWLVRRGRAASTGHEWRLEWVRDERPAGAVIDERRVGTDYLVRVSAGAIADEDLAILKLEPVPPLEGIAKASAALSGTLAELQAAVAGEFVKGAPVVDVGAGLAALRRVLATDRAAAFHELIERWRRGDDEATAWARLLASDKRFDFACHPRIDPASGTVAAAMADDPYLAWDFDDRVPAGADIAITFALEPGRARRVISRGPRVNGSPADRAEALAAAVGPDGALAPLAADAIQATDRWSHFRSSSPHPREAARRLLDALLEDESAPSDVRAATFAAAVHWCASLGLDVVPANWSPHGAVTPEAVAGESLRHEFNEAVPSGSVVVRGFGLRGPDGMPFVGAISAGPAPPGFAAIETAARAAARAGPAWATIAQRIDDLPKHTVSGTLALAGSNLFDALWQAAAADVPEGLADWVDALKSGLMGFLKEACGMLPFEPSALGDYPTAWMRESDGRPPKGRRIRRVVRPGLRTLDNTLVRPALVVTE